MSLQKPWIVLIRASSRRAMDSSRFLRRCAPAATSRRASSSWPRSLSFSSPAARSVKVTATTVSTCPRPSARTLTRRAISSVVLPVPAAASTTSDSSSEARIRSRSLRSTRESAPLSSAQPVELAGVVAGDLAKHVGWQMAELFLDVLGRLRPHAVGMRVVGAPHEGLDPDVVDELGADGVELEGRLALAPPVVGRLHFEAEVAEAVLPVECHPVEGVRKPADAALAERDVQLGIALEHSRADDRGHDVDQIHLEAGHAGEVGGAAGESGLPVAHLLGHRREGVEVQRQLDLV